MTKNKQKGGRHTPPLRYYDVVPASVFASLLPQSWLSFEGLAFRAATDSHFDALDLAASLSLFQSMEFGISDPEMEPLANEVRGNSENNDLLVGIYPTAIGITSVAGGRDLGCIFVESGLRDLEIKEQHPESPKAHQMKLRLAERDVIGEIGSLSRHAVVRRALEICRGVYPARFERVIIDDALTKLTERELVRGNGAGFKCAVDAAIRVSEKLFVSR